MLTKNPRIVKILFFAVAVGLLIFLSVRILFSPTVEFFMQRTSSFVFETAGRLILKMANFSIDGQESRRLREENSRLLLGSAEVEILRKENNEFRKAAGLSESLGKNVLAVSPAGFFRLFGNEILVINLGRESGIRSGDIVFTEDKVYVGRVLMAGEGTAEVLLASSPYEVFDVVFSTSGVSARAKGRAGGEFTIDFVPNEILIAPEEFVGILPKNAHWPQGLILGRVFDKGTVAGGIFKEVSAVHLFNPSQPPPIFVILLGR